MKQSLTLTVDKLLTIHYKLRENTKDYDGLSKILMDS